ncbi:hypothetical protein FJT64_005423 [Amphibalanus amphitrite]|uniref:LisH domain-containing protein n=2 Tax=Amphibalanus amphitrite TaxID=1232801 RepID=A0A6A4VZZ6_AMPAM|nr:hypothetical protein FJT64_005423 [Amphibalanus amphitrite]
MDLMPSEVARLVLGYLKEAGCETAWRSFLNESADLAEVRSLQARGRAVPCGVQGLSLLQTLEQYSTARSLVQDARLGSGGPSDPSPPPTSFLEKLRHLIVLASLERLKAVPQEPPPPNRKRTISLRSTRRQKQQERLQDISHLAPGPTAPIVTPGGPLISLGPEEMMMGFPRVRDVHQPADDDLGAHDEAADDVPPPESGHPEPEPEPGCGASPDRRWRRKGQPRRPPPPPPPAAAKGRA